ncbi:MAG: hypothetical protein AB2784_18050, partial [Candidatus Thiodiazotropha endolucinida]
SNNALTFNDLPPFFSITGTVRSAMKSGKRSPWVNIVACCLCSFPSVAEVIELAERFWDSVHLDFGSVFRYTVRFGSASFSATNAVQ